jgi:hypothetical protein
MEVYYRQKAFAKEHGKYANTLGELGISDPAIEMTASAAEFTASSRAGSSVVHVRQDSKLWVDADTQPPTTRPAAAQSECDPTNLHEADPKIIKIVSEISQERIAGIMKKLGSFETRNTWRWALPGLMALLSTLLASTLMGGRTRAVLQVLQARGRLAACLPSAIASMHGSTCKMESGPTSTRR